MMSKYSLNILTLYLAAQGIETITSCFTKQRSAAVREQGLFVEDATLRLKTGWWFF